MSPTCPISTRRVDVNMLRVISFQVALFTVVLVFTEEIFYALILLFDFFMRTIRKSNLSPFYIVGKLILTSLDVAPKLSDESPKRFALYLGLVVSLLLVVLFAAGLSTFAAVVAVILFVCAFLETLFDFCIGCKIYYAIQLAKALVKR